MKSARRLLSMSILILLISLIGRSVIGPAGTLPTAAQGEHLAHFSGTLNPGEAIDPIFQVFGSLDKDINLEMQVDEVAGDGSIDLVVNNASSATTFAGTILDGENLWASATLTPGTNTFSLHNPGSLPLDYDLWLHDVGESPYSLGGASRGAGTWGSHINLSFPESGLYQLDFGAAAGRYQLLVGEERVQKTVEQSGSVTYYVEAGVHSLHIMQDSDALQTDWTLDVSGPGATADVLPYVKSGGNLGGSGNDFVKEWLPLKLDTSVHANFQLSLTGAPSDAFDVLVFAADDSLLSSVSNVYGGETVWWTTDLPAAVSRIQLVANPANAAPLSYDLSVHSEPTLSTTPTTWTGSSLGTANNSTLRFQVASAGLFDFAFDADPGRFQLEVDGEPFILKTVESSDTARFFLPAGTHVLTILQDPLLPETDWSLSLVATGLAFDSLPYTQSGGNLGGAGNPFEEDRLPLYLEEGQQANFRLDLFGDLDDGVQVMLYHNGESTPAYASPVVYGQESFWWTAELVSGVNQIQIVADSSNTASLAYELFVEPIPMVQHDQPCTWAGLAKDEGGNSEVELEMPVSATYQVVVDIPVGFANVFITGTTGLESLQPRQAHYEFYAPLEEGDHLFQVWQSSAHLTTTWAITVSLWEAPAPQITGVEPVSVTNNVSHELTIQGAGFQPGAEVQLGTFALSPVTRQDSATLRAPVPAGLPAGQYSLTVTNPDGQSATLADALLVTKPVYHVYMPVVFVNAP